MKTTTQRTVRCRQRASVHGVALIIVLWMVMLLSVIAGGIGIAMRTETRLAANAVDNARAYALAEAGVYHAIAELLNLTPDEQSAADGNAYPWTFDGHELNISVRDESGRIDLNAASRELLLGLLRSAAEAPAADNDSEDDASLVNTLDRTADRELEALADAILDWRDEDDARGNLGAEAADYRAAGLDYEPANAPFRSVGELGSVLGMTPELLRRISPALTVYMHQSGVNPAFASRQALLAVPGLSAQAVDAYLALRDENHAAALPAPPPPPEMGSYLSRIQGRVYSIAVDYQGADHGRARIDVTVSLQSRDVLPYTLLAWRDGGRGG